MDFELLVGIFPQVLLDGLLLGLMYALIALGYTMVYGVLEFINFAHSEIFVLGSVFGVEILLMLQSAGQLTAWLAALHLLVHRPRVGTALRAVAQDHETASLMPMPVNRVMAVTFFVGGATGGLARVLFGLHYSLVNPYSGFPPRKKVVTARVLGG